MSSLNKSTLPKSALPNFSGRKSELPASARDRKADPDGLRDGAVYPLDNSREALSQDELLELGEREVIIQHGLKAFFEVGEALMAIREKRLYRQSYDTFAEYCDQRWGFSDEHARRFMRGAETYTALLTPPMGGVLPTNERQVRPLAQLETDEEKQVAWQQAVDTAPGGKVTGAHVQSVVDGMKPRPPVTEPPDDGKTLYPVTPSDNPLVEHARQLALKAVGNSIEQLNSKISGREGHSSPAPNGFNVNFGGGYVLLNYGKPNESRPNFARDQVAVRLEVNRTDSDGQSSISERLYRFHAHKLLEWKLTQVSDEPVDDYVPEVEEVQADGGAALAIGGAELTVGATVWTKSGHTGKVLSINGRIVVVETVNGTKPYDAASLIVVEGDEEEAGTPTGESIENFVEQTYEFASAEVKQQIIDEHYQQKAAEREARRQEMEARRSAALSTPLPTGKYRCLVIDPPWPVQKIEREVRPNQDEHLDYPTMSLEDIQALPIRDLADEGGCHLYLWTTQKFLPAALLMVSAWDFEYQCVMPWVKPSGMTPYSWMYNVEFVVFARRGGLALLQNGLKLSIEAASEGHSVKPDAFYQKVLKASPEPRLDMFARRERDGFAVWGDEVEQAS